MFCVTTRSAAAVNTGHLFRFQQRSNASGMFHCCRSITSLFEFTLLLKNPHNALIVLLSDNAYSVWMTREASLAVEEWAQIFLLSHQHIRTVHADKGSGDSKSAHDESISTLLRKLDEQGW